MAKLTKISLSEARDIPFDRLVVSSRNVRRVQAGVSIDTLAEDIARRTLLQSLSVRPITGKDGQPTDKYEVQAGGRRYHALALLVKQKRLAKNAPIPVGLVYIDFDADLNPPEESDGALDWTGVAHMLDIPGSAQQLADIGPRRPLLSPQDVLLFAVENVTEGEAKTIRKRGIQMISLSDVKADPQQTAQQALQWAARYERLLVHIDVDVLTYVECPIAENVRRCEGLSMEEIGAVLRILLNAPNWRALTITEVNPDHAPDEAEIFGRLIAMLAPSLGRVAA